MKSLEFIKVFLRQITLSGFNLVIFCFQNGDEEKSKKDKGLKKREREKERKKERERN
jgi:hypothetical protein